jgi:hypothetical protein
MVLLFNVFLTGQSSTKGQWESMGIGYDRGHLNRPNRLEILKYSLASYAVAYPWKRVILNLEIDPNYLSLKHQKELKEFALQVFKNTEVIYSDKRNIHQQDWINTYSLINDDLIFYQCNHDHIFIDNSTKYLSELVDLKEKYNDTFTVSTSHFPEAIRTSKCGYIDHHESSPKSFSVDYCFNENHLSKTGINLDSLIIITKKLYENWFLKGEWNKIQAPTDTFPSGQIELPRTEGVGVIGLGGIKDILQIPLPKQTIITPFKELFRHFDGYYHQFITNNQCPAIDIPPGFFENDIKIRYGYDDYKEGWININPKNPNYYAADKSGTDYKFTLEDIPLVWKDRISIIDSNSDINEEEMIQYKLKSVLEMIYTNPKYDPYIDPEVENKILNKYLENHSEYEY